MSETKTQYEFSAGGIVRDGGNLLMVKVQNLEGMITWTFPKGHIENGEDAPQAALREVQEETGYCCEIVPPPVPEGKQSPRATGTGGGIVAPFETVEYFFKRDGHLVKKKVTWFLMKPITKTGLHDADEIIETRWMPLAEAETLAKYKSDKQLLSKLREK